MPLTEPELTQAIRDLETARVERKATFTKRDSASIRRTICAFANDLPHYGLPGVLLFGVADDGTVPGIEASDADLRTLTDFARDGSLRPAPRVEVETRQIDGRTIVVMLVFPVETPPALWDGNIWVRVGPGTQRTTRDDERHLAERRRNSDLPFDARPVRGATLRDLDITYFEEDFLPLAVSAEVLDENDRDIVARLSAQKLCTPDGLPTAAGIISCGRHPRTLIECDYVQLVWYDGTDVDAPVLEQGEFSGRLAEIVATVEGKLRVANRAPMDRAADLHEVRPLLPEVAVREIFRNALLHRSYEDTRSPVSVSWFSDRLEIRNPGGPYGAAARPFGAHNDYRNPVLASCMKPLRLCERHGTGIRRARLAMEKNGNPPIEFDVTPAYVHATLRFRAPG